MDIKQNFRDFITGNVIKAIKGSRRILISDTTLRDGEQAPGASLNSEEKLQVAKKLDALGVDSIETGFPASSKEEFDAVRLISASVKRPILTALSRCLKGDIEKTKDAFRGNPRWGISLFLGTSPFLRKFSLDKSQEELLAILREAIGLARKYTLNVAFGAEDATRTEPEFLYRVYREAISAGAVVIGVPDTVGRLLPDEVKGLINGIRDNVPNIDKVLLATHFHNDLGLAVANSLAAVQSGANIVQCTINGLGERAGNASLEEFVVALAAREDHYGLHTNIRTKRLYETSRLVADLTGLETSANKPIVGKNVFATEAGIHQAALLRDRMTYEFIRPEDVGQSGTRIVLGRHSGKHAVYDRLRKLGFNFEGKDGSGKLDEIYKKFKKTASTKKEVGEEELAGIAREIF